MTSLLEGSEPDKYCKILQILKILKYIDEYWKILQYLNDPRGKQQIILTGNMDNQEVRAELELNMDKPGADIKLYQNGNCLF